MSDVTRHSTIRGLAWSFFERAGQQCLQLVFSIVLARILSPAEFGVIAMLYIFMSLAQALLDSGFGSALVRAQNTTRLDESSVFYFNIVIGCAAAGVLWLTAPAIAAFYAVPILVPLTRWLSLNMAINAFGVVQTAILTRRIDFKSQMKASLTSTLISGALGVALAYKGYGVWSLVAQSLSSNLIRTVLLWFLSAWRPLLAFSLKSLTGMFGFGSMILVTSMLNTVFYNIYLLIIGKLFTATELGYYSRAQSFQQVPVQQVLSVTIARVLFPVFSAMQEDKARLKRSLQRALTMTALINFPFMAALAAMAEPFIRVLITDKWLPAVPYLQLLCAVGALFPLQQINLNALKAQGRSDLYFRVEVATKLFIIAAILITYRWGIEALIIGQIATSCIAYYFYSYYSGKFLGYPFLEQVRDVAPTLLISIAVGGIIYLISLAGIPNLLVLLLAQTAAGLGLYFTLCGLFKLPAFIELMDITAPKVRKVFARKGNN